MKQLNDAQCKREILARLSCVRPETQRQWGRMSAPQMIAHLCDSFRAVMGEKPMSPAQSWFWKLTKWGALNVPMQWPRGVRTRPELDQLVGGTPPGEFEADVQRLASAIDRFTAQPRGFEFVPHPMFGQMTKKEWMRWGYLHSDHHLRQFGA